MRLFALVVCLLAGCIHDDLVACPGETVCPVGLQCDTIHGGCITSDQSTACLGMPDQEQCIAGDVHGYCLDQICVQPGCGNHIIEEDELCDDGNRRDGDGCSATCTSQERCGDGAVDHSRGEECDDGNRQSHDGCDSQCLTETAMWTIDEIGPGYMSDARHVTYDATRAQVVIVEDGYVWGWNGTKWSVLSSDAPTLAHYSVAYDEVRKTLVVLGEHPLSGDIIEPDPQWDQLYEWNGTSWTYSIVTNPLRAYNLAIACDPPRSKMFMFAVATTGLVAGDLDISTATSTAVAAPTAPTHADVAFGLAFDAARSRIVVVTAGTDTPTVAAPMVHEWSGGSWSSSTVSMATRAGWAIYYDGLAQAVVAVGSDTFAAASSPAQAWTGTAWTDLPAVNTGFNRPEAAFDASRQTRVIVGGSDVPGVIAEGTATAWQVLPRTAPPYGLETSCAFDEPRQREICAGNALGSGIAETWSYDGGWTMLARGVQGEAAPQAIAYDPIRDALIGWAATGFYQLVGTSWQVLPVTQPGGAAADGIAFDPIRKRLVAVGRPLLFGPPFTIFLTPDNQITKVTSVGVRHLAFDARNAEIFAIGSGGNALHLVNDNWAPAVGPGFTYSAVSNARRGTVELFSPGAVSVERVGTEWIESPAPPVTIDGSVVMNQATGELHILGSHGASRFMLHRRWVSATPTEDCSDGATADLDGDGVSGCGDPDCWTTCTPACPPLVSCP